MTTAFGTELIAAALDQMAGCGAEEITYTPSGGVARTILAIVDRAPLEAISPQTEAVRPNIAIEVLNRATASATDGYGGISGAEVNTGGDTILVTRRIGEAARAMRVSQILGQDEAMLTLELR